MAMIEVKANLAFQDWKQGGIRTVDGNDPVVIGLVYAGYLTVLDVLPDDPMPPAKPKKAPRSKKVHSGPSDPQQAGGDPDGAAAGDPAGAQSVSADAAGS